MFGTISDPRIGHAVGSAFGGAGQHIREARGRSAEGELRGERGRREDSDTDALIDEMKGVITERIHGITNELGGANRIEIEFYPTNLPTGEETRFGADIGIRMHVRTRSFNLTKGAIFQCKRMYARGKHRDFREVAGRGEQQANNMLALTPASFFLLFNFGEQGELLNRAGIPVSSMCPMVDGGGPIPAEKAREIGSNCPYWQRSGGSLWDMGISVLPAARVFAISRECQAKSRPFPTDAESILAGSVPLGVFMADIFGACLVGDVRDEVVRIVTPPALRDLRSTGLLTGPPADFSVRHIIDLTVRAIEG